MGSDWCGKRVSPSLLLGDGIGAAAAWRSVAAVAELQSGSATADWSLVSAVGDDEQAGAVLFQRFEG